VRSSLLGVLVLTGCMGTADFTPTVAGGGAASSRGGGAGGGAVGSGGGAVGSGGGVVGSGGGVAASGGGVAASGGGVAASGGGVAATGGGVAASGGGVAASGGGVAASGGGVASSGGGSAGTGGGVVSSGGGSAGIGGGFTYPPTPGGVATKPPPGGPGCSASITCGGHGTCYSDNPGTHVCQCDPGYYARLADGNCEAATGTVCDGQTCGGFGTCLSQIFGGFSCECLPGFAPYGSACIRNERMHCQDHDGSWKGRGETRCSPDDTYIEVCHDSNGDGLMEWMYGVACANGLSCSGGCLGAKCPDQPCAVGTNCVMEAHGQPLGVCVETCDCLNCGNCGPDNSDHRWDDEQEACGNAPNTNPPLGACNMPCTDPGSGCIPYYPNAICWPLEGCFSAPPPP
jgi:hypothetical protein